MEREDLSAVLEDTERAWSLEHRWLNLRNRGGGKEKGVGVKWGGY